MQSGYAALKYLRGERDDSYASIYIMECQY
jgi:hypothetical protein